MSQIEAQSKRLTVVIPCYNQGHFLKECIDSVVNNDHKNICEIIVINDGSTDEMSNQLMRDLNQEGLTVHHQENEGLASARNKGAELSNCDYLLFLDADNKITKEFLNVFISKLDAGETFDAIHGDRILFGEKSNKMKSDHLNLFKIAQANYIDACAIVKKSTLLELGGYDGNMPHMGWEDWDLWIRMALYGKKVDYVNSPLFYYRYSADSMIRTIGHRENEIRQYFVKKYNNIMFSENFVKNNNPNTSIEELTTKEILKRVWKRYF